MMLLLPLIILTALTIFGVTVGLNPISTLNLGGSGVIVENGVEKSIILPTANYTFMFSATSIIILFTIIIGLSILIGVKFLGSGLTSISVKTIITISLYLLLWGGLTVTSSTMITSIPVFGEIIYAILTLMYVLGVYNKIKGGESEE